MTVRKPPYSIEGGMKASVVSTLEEMLVAARRGEIIGLAYVTVSPAGDLDGGAAGNLGRDMLKAAGALYQAAGAATRN